MFGFRFESCGYREDIKKGMNGQKNNFDDNYNLVYSDTIYYISILDIFSIHCLDLFERYDSIQGIKRGIKS